MEALKLDNSFRYIEKKWVTFYTDLLDSAVWYCINDMENNWEFLNFDSKRQIFHLSFPTSFVLAYDDEKLRDSDAKKFLDIDVKTSTLRSPRFCGIFTFKGKYCIYLIANRSMQGIIDQEKGIYKSVIVNPSLYQNQDKIWNLELDVKDKVRWLIES